VTKRVQKNRKIIYNSAEAFSISLKFRTDFDLVTLDVSCMNFQGQRVKGQGHSVT